MGEAAAIQRLVTKGLFESEDQPLSPEIMRYLARQCKQILVYRKYQNQYASSGAEGKTIDVKANEDLREVVDSSAGLDEELIDIVDSVPVEDIAPSAAFNDAGLLNEFIGAAAQKSIEEEADEIDFSELTRIDMDIATSLEKMSDAFIEQQVAELESKAIKEDARISQMSLRERTQHDKIYPFSVKENDEAIEQTIADYNEKKRMQKAMVEKEAEGETFDEKEKAFCFISPEEEAEVEALIAAKNLPISNFAEEFREEINIDEESMQKILDLVTQKEGLDDEETATEFFDSIWTKLELHKRRIKDNKPLKPKFLDGTEGEIDY